MKNNIKEKLLELQRKMIINLLSKCTDGNISLFKKMYSHDNLDLPLTDIVNSIDISKLDHICLQIQNTLDKNNIEYDIDLYTKEDVIDLVTQQREVDSNQLAISSGVFIYPQDFEQIRDMILNTNLVIK